MLRHDRIMTLMALVIIASGTQAFAVIIVPPTLNPGDQYRLAFVSSTTKAATSPLIDDYNSFVDDLGDEVIASDWKAIASTPSIDARTNTGTDPLSGIGVRIFLLDGSKLVDDNTDLWDGDLDTRFDVTELGSVFSSEVWTGSDIFGAAANPLGASSPIVGNNLSVTAGWVQVANNRDQSDLLPLYALSGVLTVPGGQATPQVPEPGTFTIFTFGAAMLMGARGYRRWRASESS